MEPLIWIVLGVVLVIAELFTATFFLVMLGVGAFAAAGAAALGASMGIQAIVFAAVSALTVFAVRPVIERHRRPAVETGEQPFGVAAITGTTAVVLDRVDQAGGLVKIGGEMWSARAYDVTQVLAPGERVRVIEISGAIALVWRNELSAGEPPESKR